MDVDLFIKKLPFVVKELISREAFDNRRSINQEAIALLEEALIQRVGAPIAKRKQMEALLEGYAGAAAGEPVAVPEPPRPAPSAPMS